MSSQKKISSFFMKKANDETIQPGSAGDQGSEELKTGAVADVDVKVIPLESNEPETLMPSSLPAKHLQGMMSWMNDSEKIQLSTDLRAIIDRTVEEWKTSGELFENSTIFDSPIKEGLKTSPRLKNVSSVVFSFKLSKFVLADLKQDLDSHGGGTDEALVNILTSVTNRPDSKSNFQSIEVKCFEDIIREVTNIIKAGVELEDTNPAYTTSVTDETDEVEPEDSASCDHVETILESDDDDDDDDESVVSGSTVSSIYSTDGQGEGDVTDVFPKGPGDGRDDEVTAGSGADFPGLRSFLAEDEAEEEEETEVTLVQHAAQTSPIIVHRAYYASSCGSL